MRELRSTQIEGKIYLFPVPVVKERKYLIYCSSEAEARELALAVRTQQVTHPDLISEYFLYLALHTDKQTKIYVFNPEMKMNSKMNKVYYELSGQGPVTLLFVHGWGGNTSWWKSQRDHFQSRYQVALLDLPGHGKSLLGEGELTSQKYAEAIRSVVDELPGEEVILIGHSMAGAYVLEPVLRSPKVKKIILVDTLKDLDQVFTFEQADKMLFDLYRKDFKHAIEDIMGQFLFSPKTPENIRKQITDEFLKLEADYAIKLLAPLYKMNPAPLAQIVSVPVRAINSDYSPSKPENNQKYFRDFKEVIISDCGHYPMLERPEEFNRLLEQSLDS